MHKITVIMAIQGNKVQRAQQRTGKGRFVGRSVGIKGVAQVGSRGRGHKYRKAMYRQACKGRQAGRHRLAGRHHHHQNIIKGKGMVRSALGRCPTESKGVGRSHKEQTAR